MMNFPAIASGSATADERGNLILQLRNHPSTALRVTLDEIATPTFGGFAMTVPECLDPRDLKITRAQHKPPGHNPACGEIKTQRNIAERQPPGHNFAKREIRTQRNRVTLRNETTKIYAHGIQTA